MSATAIDRLLAEQADLTAVGRFSRAQGTGRMDRDRQRSYESLIPLTQPRQGEQYAFAVDLDRCTGCKACVAGCHSLNGLETEETWREVGVLVDSPGTRPRQQTVTSACHHCADPGCLTGCPVLAYEKDEVTGIVRHLDDQCIGCQYCVLKCPYEVPKYSKRLGIVRKCDMCHSRLAAGEAPACVQACPTEAISIRIASTSSIQEFATNQLFLPDSPDPAITKPSTIYVSKRPLSERAMSADHRQPQVQPAHWPLVFLLVLSQAGTGLLTAAFLGDVDRWLLPCGIVFILAGLLASVLHPGRPSKAWRSFLGWRRSWLSREVIVLGACGGLAVAVGAMHAMGAPAVASRAVLGATVGAGWLGVICSAWVYHDTQRAVWRGPLSFARFLGTASLFTAWGLHLSGGFVCLLTGKLLIESGLALRGTFSELRLTDLDRSGRLLRGPLRGWLAARLAFGSAAVLLPFTASAAFLAILIAGEILERALYFKAGVAKPMPGQSP